MSTRRTVFMTVVMIIYTALPNHNIFGAPVLNTNFWNKLLSLIKN